MTVNISGSKFQSENDSMSMSMFKSNERSVGRYRKLSHTQQGYFGAGADSETVKPTGKCSNVDIDRYNKVTLIKVGLPVPAIAVPKSNQISPET
jgi:hypothetical protein